MESSDALPLILQHPSINQEVVCRLLCTSKSLRAAITLHCAGQLSLHCSATSQPMLLQLATWVAQHGQLLKAVAVAVPACSSGKSRAAAAASAASTHVGSSSSRSSFGVLVQQLNRRSLTRLEFRFRSSEWQGGIIPATCQALSSLSRLQSLSLVPPMPAFYGTEHGLDPFLPSLANLTRLTHLVLRGVKSVAPLAHIPVQVVHLDLAVTPHDQLPGQLQTICIGDCHRVKPLLPLQHLQSISLHQSTTPPQQLEQLSRLTALREVQLSYVSSWGVASAAAAAWTAVPMCHLIIGPVDRYRHEDHGVLSAAALQQLASLQGLTYLSLVNCDPIQVTMRAFGNMLLHLTRLQELRLARIGFQESLGGSTPAEQQEHAETAALVAAIAGLPHLSSLELSLPLQAAAATQLTAAQQLTSLVLIECSLVDSMLDVVVSSLTGLRKLVVSNSGFVEGPDNNAITDTGVLCIAQHLALLTELCVDHNVGITDAGVKQLTSIRGLQVPCV